MEDMLYVEGERVYLRELKPEDVTDAMMEWFQDAELMRFYTNSGRKIDKAELCHSIQKGRNEQSNYTLGIYLKAESRIIGTVKIGPINWKHKISDLATLIGDRNYLGKGFSTEAIALGGQLAFSPFAFRQRVSSPGTGLKGDARRNRPLFLSSPSMCSFCGGMRGKFWFNRRHICPHWTYHECGIKPTEEGPV